MLNVKRNKSKYKGLKKIVMSTKYSIQGLVYAFSNEKSLILYTVLSLLAVLVGILLNISVNQWICLLLSLGVVLTIELINTAIEATVDMVTVEYNELAKVAKDCGSAATFVATIIAVIIAMVIFIPKIIMLF
jgi:diacylglycerol kinase